MPESEHLLEALSGGTASFGHQRDAHEAAHDILREHERLDGYPHPRGEQSR